MATPVAVFVQEGRTFDYTPVADMAAGDVVDCGTWVAIALRDIPANTLGALQSYDSPIFDFLKFTGEVIAVFDQVYWDQGTLTCTKTVGYSEARIGYCVAPAAAGDLRVRVKLAPPLT